VIPLPVGASVIVPVATAQVGCVAAAVGAAAGCALIVRLVKEAYNPAAF
jgi:hypothetical protein